MRLGFDGLRLSTGRVIAANHGLLSPGNKGELYEGFDAIVGCSHDWWDGDDGPLTEDERREIRDHMIERWRKWGGQ